MLSPSPFHLYRVIFLFCLLVAALRVAPALAQPAQRDFNIPPQALSSALKAYADNTNLQLLYPSEIAQGLRSNSVVRNRTPQEALSILLQGTGLSFRFVDDKTVTVSQAENSSQQDPTKTLRIEEIQVTAEREHDYRVQEATTATKTDTPLRDIPQLI